MPTIPAPELCGGFRCAGLFRYRHGGFQRLRLLRMDGRTLGLVLGGEVLGELDLQFVLHGFAAAPTLKQAIAEAYANIAKIRVAGSYYRTDVGQSLWPPGTV